MIEQIEILGKQLLQQVEGVSDAAGLESLRVSALGKKGAMTAILKGMGALSAEERPAVGQAANHWREKIENAIAARGQSIGADTIAAMLRDEIIDVTLPGRAKKLGHKHPMSIVLDEVIDIFLGMGFSVAEGPEVELAYYVFDALNTSVNHPSRDMQDTFYIQGAPIEDHTGLPSVLLRTQTSSVQIRVMEQQKPPIRIISPGRTYRKDEVDATHSPNFSQIEGLVVDKGITMADLKGTLDTLTKSIFGSETRTRFRPHFFPYTEPSAEVDISCYMCGGSGCRVCKYEGWIELLGSGMVHPNVLRHCHIDPDVYSGFAFGVGLERLALGRYGIDDMRLLYDSDMRFLRQF
jgi:phenylalanyl-tRNA synthetase alpha chain